MDDPAQDLDIYYLFEARNLGPIPDELGESAREAQDGSLSWEERHE